MFWGGLQLGASNRLRCARLRRGEGQEIGITQLVERYRHMEISLFNGTSLPMGAVRTSKSGAVSVGYMDRKSYGRALGVKGAALDKAHLQYRIDLGMAGNVNVSALLTSGQILAQKVTNMRSGIMRVDFMRADKLGVTTQKPEEIAAKLSDEQLLAILAARKAPAAPAQLTA